MRFLIILFPFLMLLPTNTAAQKLSDYRWKNRIVLLMNGESNKVKEQLSLLTDLKKELVERDLIIFRHENNKVLDVNNETTGINPNSVPYQDYNGLLLIGKDGGVKMKEEFIVAPEKIFELIDSMPMRRAEMKNGH